MSKNTTLVILLGMLALLSCREDRQDGQLLGSIEQTWQLCEVSLPEAEARAETLEDSVQKASELVRQRYSLLTIRMRDKRGMIPSSPDSARQTMSYFEGRKNTTDKERACYYLASAYRDLKDYPRAVNLFLKAADIAEQSKDADTLIWQNALSQLRYLYMLQLNYEEELDVALHSIALAKQSGKNLECYLMDAASAYRHLNDTMKSLLYCEQSYGVIQEEGSQSKHGRILASLLATYSDYQAYDKVDSLLPIVYCLPKELRPQNYELCLAKCHENKNLTDSAIVYYKVAYGKTNNVAGRYEASAGLQRCYLQKGDYRQAALWGQRLQETNDTIVAERAFEQTQRARDEYRYLRDKEAERAIVQRSERIVFFSVIAGLVLLSLVMGMVAFYHYKQKKLTEQLVGKDKLLEHKAMVNKELTRIALMNIATEKAENVIAHFHDVAAGRSKLEEGSWEGLMAAIETLYPDFLETVQERLNGQMRVPLLRTICLLKIGMKPAQIANVMDAKIQTVWNRVKRAEETCGDLLAVSE